MVNSNTKLNPGLRKRNIYYNFYICHWSFNSISAQSFEKVKVLEVYNTTNKFDVTEFRVSVRLQDETFNRLHCLVQLTDFVSTGMDKQMHTGMISADLQKAFDTLDHGVLLKKEIFWFPDIGN